MIIKGYRVGPLLKGTGKEILSDGVGSLAAQTAYYFFFSLFPLFLFAAPLLSLVVDRETLMNLIMSRISSTVPAEASGAIGLVLKNIVFAKNAPGLMSLGLLLAAWSGSNIFGALMDALNKAYDVDETRSWVKRQLIRLGMLVLGGIVIVVATLVLLGGEDVARTVGSFLHLGGAAVMVWNILQFPLALAFLFALAFLTYWLLPNVRQTKWNVFVASIVTTLLWVIATLLFRLYVQRFPPNPAYGIVGGIMILLTWMYYTMFVVLAGGELASELHHGTGAVEPRKGATYFGRIVSGDNPGEPSVSAG
ncbi:MAG TPA: YihY/virulence factor BrkB family protein [Gemmatimonadaceae bacterium]|nr:YihY/virulence factor BrkB family protein [Gemmatimonadaceae bacterium]